MPNWCSNIVQFSGEPEKLEELDHLFKAMSAKEEETQQGQLPPFVKAKHGYLFDIGMESGTLYYETKWVPNIGILVEIADQYQAGFVYQYHEPGMEIFGEAIYEAGVLKDIYLDSNEFDLYEYDEETDLYMFEDKSYESDIDILETMLERKKDQQDNMLGHKR